MDNKHQNRALHHLINADKFRISPHEAKDRGLLKDNRIKAFEILYASRICQSIVAGVHIFLMMGAVYVYQLSVCRWCYIFLTLVCT